MSREFRHLVSLLLNVVLVATVVALLRHRTAPPPPPSAIEVSTAIVTNEAPVLTEPPKRLLYTDIASPSDRLRWLIDQLRAAGVPNDVLARVALSDLDVGWQKRFEECRGNADTMAALQLEQEQGEDAQMRAALGPEGYQQWDQAKMLREANPGKLQLTTAESSALYALKKKMQQRHWDLEQARLNGDLDDAQINEAYDQASADYNQQAKSLLGEDRYAQSQGADAGTAAANLKQELAAANPTDSQVQDLLKAQSQLDAGLAALSKQYQNDPSSPEYAAQVKALNDARDQAYQSVLGTNVFDTVQKTQDGAYSRMKKYENLWGLDDSKVDYVYGSLQYYQQSVQDYQAQASALAAQGQTVDWDAVYQNLQQFSDQTRQSLQSYLGPDSFNKMQKNGVLQFNPNQLSAGRSY